MNPAFDIYKRLPEDRLLWVNRVAGLEEARRQVAALQAASLESYLVYNYRERAIVEVFGIEEKTRSPLAA